MHDEVEYLKSIPVTFDGLSKSNILSNLYSNLWGLFCGLSLRARWDGESLADDIREALKMNIGESVRLRYLLRLSKVSDSNLPEIGRMFGCIRNSAMGISSTEKELYSVEWYDGNSDWEWSNGENWKSLLMEDTGIHCVLAAVENINKLSIESLNSITVSKAEVYVFDID